VRRGNFKDSLRLQVCICFLAREKCGLLAVPRIVLVKPTRYPYMRMFVLESGMQSRCECVMNG